MKIKLITKEEYQTLLKIQKENNILTFQNDGYQYIDKSKFTDNDQKAFDKITEILKKSITGFQEFNNFKFYTDGRLMLRFQYNYSADDNTRYFIGVGYLSTDELLNGFNEK